MKKKISIAIDAMGGEDSPDKTIQGIKIFLDKIHPINIPKIYAKEYHLTSIEKI